VDFAATVHPESKMHFRDARSSSSWLMDRTTWKAFSRTGGFLMRLHNVICDRFSGTFPPIGVKSPASSGNNRKKVKQTWLVIDGVG